MKYTVVMQGGDGLNLTKVEVCGIYRKGVWNDSLSRQAGGKTFTSLFVISIVYTLLTRKNIHGVHDTGDWSHIFTSPGIDTR